MPRGEVSVMVTVEPLGDPEAGGWCPLCLLPSVVQQAFVMTIGTRTSLVVAGVCVECDEKED